MFETNIIKKDQFWKTKVLSKTINLWKNLDLFISASCKNTWFLDYLLNKVLDYTVDRISINNTYKDFSHSLELINAILKAWDNDDDDDNDSMNMIIWVLNKNEFLFSNIWKSSCYLIKKTNVIEITDKRDLKKEFSFISNGTLENKDVITMSSKRLLNFLSESDFIDSYNIKILHLNDSIKQILEEEKLEKNISILSFIYKKNYDVIENKNITLIKNTLLKAWDTNIIKRVIAIYLICHDKFLKKEKLLKSVLFFIIIILAIVLLYKIIWSTMQKNNNSKVAKNQIFKLEEAKTALRLASESISNKDIFELNIKKTKEIVVKLEERKLFIEDIKLLKDKIAKLNKSFDGIESFEETDERKILDLNWEETVKVIGLNKKLYIIWKNYIKWPILKWSKTKTYNFWELKDDEFIDATPLLGKIALITKKWNIVIFSTNGNFDISDVIGQEKWEKSDIISSYNSNIYLISKEENQIFKHKKSWNNFTKWNSYLTKENQNSIKNMVSIAIDWWFYILQKDLKINKFFANPKNRLESLMLNSFPENYKIEDINATLKIKTRKDLNYVYILLNNKIYITKPNSRRHQDTKSLEYLGQIEWQKNKIIDFYIKHDWELMVLNKSWIYKVIFEENDWKIMVR
jgi:hypothetical protein